MLLVLEFLRIFMEQNKPIEISRKEWKEIISIPYVRDSWGLDNETTPEEFAGTVYGVKFNYTSSMPGYVGDLYLIIGDDDPITIIRKNGKLIIQPNIR
ncbi:MAG TPA: hypothetical protein VK808_12600 [Bacteroidia bacterium]|jgi:hypothetical protein|nr:hypothetical protein [Bacteroidia bacterium]